VAPLATGPGAIAVGIGTKATATASAAFGKGITANETESLALSGIAYAKNFYFNGDPRLVEDVQDVEPSQMLRNTEKLRVVSHAPSRNYCRHQGRAAADCARDRSVGLLADKAPSDAVREGTSLTLGDPTRGGRMLEHVAGVQSLDVRALLAQLVGSVQELSAQLHSKDAQIAVLAKQNQEQLGHRVAALEMVAAQQ